jgi:hypothetical protein
VARAVGNTVRLEDVAAREVYGGLVNGHNGPTSGLATGNTVIVEGAATIGDVLAGGEVTAGTIFTTQDDFSGNALHVRRPGGVTAKDVRNFEYYRFVLDGAAAAAHPALAVTGDINLYDTGPGADRPSRIESVDTVGASPLAQGAEVVLIDASSGNLNLGTFAQTAATGAHGIFVSYDYALIASGGRLVAKVTSLKVGESAKSLSEGFLGGLGLVNLGADHVAGPALEAAAEAVRGPVGAPILSAFGAVSGGSLRYRTGSHVDVKGLGAALGAAYGLDLEPGVLILGLFAEHGRGGYDTCNSFASVGDVLGRGDTSYFGGGLMARLEFSGTRAPGLYAEASGRLGRVRNEYESSDLLAGRKAPASYDSDTPYLGLHLGLGYKLGVTDSDEVDLYAKYFWSHQKGDEVVMSVGDRIDFDDVDSHRVRVGGRVSHWFAERLSLYGGLAVEHEFDGQASALAYGLPIAAPSMKGTSGMGELGVGLKPSADGPLTIELGAQGYAGKRRGVTGNLVLDLRF